jgi:membrane protein YqaA with SNARE-associated domain
MEQYEMVHDWFMRWGFWIIFIASFSPIPYKVFTVTAGLVGIAFLPFLIASIIGRGGRFYLVSFLMALGGPKLEQAIHRFLLRFGWLTVGLFLAVVVGYYMLNA